MSQTLGTEFRPPRQIQRSRSAWQINSDLRRTAGRRGRTDCCQRSGMNRDHRDRVGRSSDADVERHNWFVHHDILLELHVARRGIL